MRDAREEEGRLRPVLKWAGGKSQLLGEIAAGVPEEYGEYWEPFLGGAAVLFGIRPERAHASDANPRLMNLYACLRDDAAGLVRRVEALDAAPCTKERYMAVRDLWNDSPASGPEAAALMIWINKHCFNGLYRENAKGRFNVPWNGRASGSSIDAANALAAGEWLRRAGVSLSCTDFEEALEGASAGDFAYIDSPYVPEGGTASFTSYRAGGFPEEEHRRLAALFRRLDARGVRLMLSNNDVPLVRRLYEGYRVRPVAARRSISRDASGRDAGREVLVTNYDPPGWRGA